MNPPELFGGRSRNKPDGAVVEFNLQPVAGDPYHMHVLAPAHLADDAAGVVRVLIYRRVMGQFEFLFDGFDLESAWSGSGHGGGRRRRAGRCARDRRRGGGRRGGSTYQARIEGLSATVLGVGL